MSPYFPFLILNFTRSIMDIVVLQFVLNDLIQHGSKSGTIESQP